MTRRVALISEHASPLALLGGTDSGGQNVYVGQLARHLACLGYDVDVFTRRDSETLPEQVEWMNGVRIVHVPAGPPARLRKERLLPHMAEFTAWMIRFITRERRPYHLLHANFWMSALAAAEIKRALDIPFVVTFHALGRVRRFHQREADEFPDDRFVIEDRVVAEADHVIAECPQDEEDLIRLYNADPARITIVPCGFDPMEFWPVSKQFARIALGLPQDQRVILQLGRLVPRKGIDNVIRGLGRLRREHRVDARLLIVGGDDRDAPTPLARRTWSEQGQASRRGRRGYGRERGRAPQGFDEGHRRQDGHAQESGPAEEGQGRTEDDGEGSRAWGADPPPATAAGTDDGATPARVDAGRPSGHRQGDGHHAAWRA